MALAITFPLALQAQTLACRPLPRLFPRPRPPRPAARWLRLALDDLVAWVAAAIQLLHGLERGRHGLNSAVADARSSSRLPGVAVLTLPVPAIADRRGATTAPSWRAVEVRSVAPGAPDR
jgi:hypothetical protein